MRHAIGCALLAVVAVAGQPIGSAADAPAKEKEAPYDTTDRYAEQRIEGWKVLVNKRLLAKEHQELRERTLRVLGEHLFQITRVIPAEALTKLRAIPIWVELEHPRHPCMCYHPSPEWLRAHDMNPQKAGGVEIANARNFITWTLQQPSMVLHEMAHGYHHQVLGFDNPEVRACYDRAVESKSYLSVLHINGRKQRHYALTNDKEYFAEATEAYFGTNDFYPFVRAELKQHDPGAHELMEKLWGVKARGKP